MAKDPATLVGLPDGPTAVEIKDPTGLTAAIEVAICTFRKLRPGTQTLINAEVNTYHKEVGIRVVQNGRRDWGRNGEIEESLLPAFTSLRSTAKKNRVGVDYWGGNNYFDLSIRYPNPDRNDLLDELDHLPWDEQYRARLERESWSSLRGRVFRFSNFASTLAARCIASGMSTVLVPSVGICVHPWLFASQGLTATATDSATTALKALSDPVRYLNLYSTGAYERWDRSTSAAFAMIPHPGHFEGMPALQIDQVREGLRQRIAFVRADWASLPVASGTVDLVFATNAVPRGSQAERVAVLEEWVRILRDGGFIFIAQHHAATEWGVESLLRERGLHESDLLGGEEPCKGPRGGFQVYRSSG